MTIVTDTHMQNLQRTILPFHEWSCQMCSLTFKPRSGVYNMSCIDWISQDCARYHFFSWSLAWQAIAKDLSHIANRSSHGNFYVNRLSIMILLVKWKFSNTLIPDTVISGIYRVGSK